MGTDFFSGICILFFNKLTENGIISNRECDYSGQGINIFDRMALFWIGNQYFWWSQNIVNRFILSF